MRLCTLRQVYAVIQGPCVELTQLNTAIAGALANSLGDPMKSLRSLGSGS